MGRGPQTTIVCMNPSDLLSSRRLLRGRLPRRSHGLLLGGTWLRVRTWRRAHELDDALARGGDPFGSDELSLRAGQLRSTDCRARFARALLAAVELADRELPPASAMAPLIRRSEVQDCRELVLELAERLGEDKQLNVQGLAMTSRLLTEGCGPLYHAHAEHSLAAVLRAALVAIDRDPAGPTPAPRRNVRRREDR